MLEKKALVCSEFFYPEVGGAQEVSRRICEILKENYRVYVLTSFNDQRDNKIKDEYGINHFKIAGNFTKGIKGDVESAINFIKKNEFAIIIFYAAQQWTFDLFVKYPYLFSNNTKYFFFPCGFSKLRFINYKNYFRKLLCIVDKFDQIIFHSKLNNDYKFLSNKINFEKIKIIKNGFINYTYEKNINIYQKFNITKDSTIVPYISNINYLKGQIRVLRLLNKINLKKKLIIFFISKSNIDNKFFYFNFFKLYIKYFFNNKNVEIKVQFDLTKDLINSIYRNSYFFLFCSRLECSPLVIYEAIQYELPVVSFDVGDTKELISENNFGYIVNNDRDFINSCHILLDNNHKYKQIKNNLALLKNKYDWNEIKKNYFRLFNLDS